MISKMVKKVPKKTDYEQQHKVIQKWAKVIVESNRSDGKIKAYSIKDIAKKGE